MTAAFLETTLAPYNGFLSYSKSTERLNLQKLDEYPPRESNATLAIDLVGLSE